MERETLINRGSGLCQGRSIRAASDGAGLGAPARVFDLGPESPRSRKPSGRLSTNCQCYRSDLLAGDLIDARPPTSPNGTALVW